MDNTARVVAFMDVGTNSIRLLMVRVNPNHSYTVLTQQKEVVRLGSGEFPSRHLRRDAMDRAVLVCTKFAEMARSNGADDMIAVATSATREADNQADFLLRLHNEAGLDLRVISGLEEARLIYLGVSRGMNLGDKQAVFIDIGGGSTELIVGDAKHHQYLDSLKLGSIRLAAEFSRALGTGKINLAAYGQLQQAVRNASAVTLAHVRKFRIDGAFASSGTAMNLAEIASRQFHGHSLDRQGGTLAHAHLKAVLRRLCDATLAQRRKVPGINPERADIIVPGGAILDTLMDDLGLAQITISDRAMRDGLLENYLARSDSTHWLDRMPTRERSVILLGRACGFDEPHARKVTELALQLFDSAARLGLHKLDATQREWLLYAGWLHDIGTFLSFVNHQDHTYYITRNSELLGFDQTEIPIIAAVARFHRKGFPGPGKPEVAGFSKTTLKVVRQLCVLLRLGEALDRSHAGLVDAAQFTTRNGSIRLKITPRADATLERWGAQNNAKFFEKAFGKPLVVG